MDWQARSKILLGENGAARLAGKRLLIVGVGGVGGYALETVVRCGVGNVTIVDGDVFDETNLNRQLLATRANIGKSKADEGAKRAREINPDIIVTAINARFNEATAEEIFATEYDYVVDCIDSVKDKVLLIERAHALNIPCISALGAANRLDTDFEVTDISRTHGDGLARAVRKQLRERGIERHKVVCSGSPCIQTDGVLGSVVFPPAVCGTIVGKEVIIDLLQGDKT